MIPTSSSSNKENCSPVSSNCVIWQGPAISCINLCKGDTVSDVVYKLAVEICAFQGEIGLSDLDLTCLLNVCNQQTTLPPSITLQIVLQLLADKVCCLNDIVENLPTPGQQYVEPTLNLPLCLQYVDPITGLVVSSLKLSDFVVVMGNKLCNIDSIVTLHTSQINTLNQQVTNLINTPSVPVLPTVTPTCILPSAATAMDVVLSELESRFCGLVNVLGSNTQLNLATSSQCTALASANALSSTGTMSGLPGWNPTVTTFGQSMQNLWITVCDMRAAIYALLDCCNQTTCNSFIVSYTVATTEDRTQVTLYFAPGTSVPSGYLDCNPLGATVTITDGLGNTFVGNANLVTESANVGGITFTVSSLNPSQTYTITVDGCITNGTQTCQKQVINTSVPPCPVVSGVTATLT